MVEPPGTPVGKKTVPVALSKGQVWGCPLIQTVTKASQVTVEPVVVDVE
jgi:hypothetical protein